LDIVHNRWADSVKLIERAKLEHWQCISSRFTNLEWLDNEHEQCYIDNFLAEGYPLSRITRLLGNRYQKAHALPRRDLEKVHRLIATYMETTLAIVDFRYPIAESFWERAEKFCDTIAISVEDAMHLSFAIESECNILVTRDKDFHTVADDYIITAYPEAIDIALTKLGKSSR
jgi:predicted nucleic acid-binding protein